MAPASIVVKGQKSEPHKSGLCPSHLKEQRETEQAEQVVHDDEPGEIPAAFAWDDTTSEDGRSWREKLRDDFDQPGVYEAFRASIVSGLTAAKGVSKACKCGRKVHVTLPDAANITRAARDILTELEGAQKEPAGKASAATSRRKPVSEMTDEELEAVIDAVPFDQAQWDEFQEWRRTRDPKGAQPTTQRGATE